LLQNAEKKQDGGWEIMKHSLYEMGVVVAIVSFLGFVVENAWLAVTKGYINNRNMNLPFLLGYGLAMAAVYILFGVPSEMTFLCRFPVKAPRGVKIILYFMCAMLCVSVGEIVLGTVTEKLCHIEYWNYTCIPFHFTKYTSVPTSIGFASMITFFMEKLFPLLMGRIEGAESVGIRIVVFILLVILLYDFVYSYGQMIRNHNFYEKWEVSFQKKWYLNA